MTELYCHSVLVCKDIGNILTSLMLTFDLQIKERHCLAVQPTYNPVSYKH